MSIADAVAEMKALEKSDAIPRAGFVLVEPSLFAELVERAFGPDAYIQWGEPRKAKVLALEPTVSVRR